MRCDALSSQGAIPQLLSARLSLTSVFGMGTGVTSMPSSQHVINCVEIQQLPITVNYITDIQATCQ